MCSVLGREGGAGAEGGGEGLRAMAAVLLRTLFDVRSDVWFRVQEHTRTGGAFACDVCARGLMLMCVCSSLENHHRPRSADQLPKNSGRH